MQDTYTEQQCIVDTKQHITNVQGLLIVFAMELLKRAKEHDQSKLESPELERFTEYTPKLKNVTYGSEKYKEYLDGLGVALNHHYENNDHHPEHFKNGVDDMNLAQIVEMFCDWKAASMRHADGDVNQSITHNKERFKLSDQLESIFRNSAPLAHQSINQIFNSREGAEPNRVFSNMGVNFTLSYEDTNSQETLSIDSVSEKETLTGWKETVIQLNLENCESLRVRGQHVKVIEPEENEYLKLVIMKECLLNDMRHFLFDYKQTVFDRLMQYNDIVNICWKNENESAQLINIPWKDSENSSNNLHQKTTLLSSGDLLIVFKKG